MKKSYQNHLFLVFALRFRIYLFVHAQPYVPTDKILLNCGGAPKTKDSDDRKWTTDIKSKFAPAEDNTLTGSASPQDSSVPQVPFMTARIFRSQFTYSFPVASGRKFVRLYFYPASYVGLNAPDAVFGVSSGQFTLLRNFSAAQTTQALNSDYIVKEFVVNVVDRRLNVTFKPSKASNAYAFVNGIEVVSMPDIYNTENGNAFIIGHTQPFIIDNSTSLENVYRLNVGGNDLSASQDTGMFRTWSDDSPYIYGAAFGVTYTTDLTIKYPADIPAYVAPTDVYATARTMGHDSNINQNYNLTWIMAIDSGFYYLVRLHFCEIQSVITKTNQRTFDIFINNQTAEEGADVIAWAQGNGIPFYKDYIVLVPRGNGQQDLWLELHPNVQTKPMYYDAILNGLEIFKINDTTGSLAGTNPIPAPKQDRIDPPSPSGKSKNQIGIITGGVAGRIVAICLLFFLGL